ncbi:two-component sensor histidine kinase, partial [Streptomyces sp. SID8455]|nr:two-component sensor histidine kinase [Streptomyces sp. SID8455]
AAPEAPPEGAVAVLWLPDHAPTSTGSFPVVRLPDEKRGTGGGRRSGPWWRGTPNGGAG